MTKEELKAKMLAFVDKQNHDYSEEWWCTPRELYEGVMQEFAAHVGIDFAVPHKDQTSPPDVNRAALLRELLPEIEKTFNLTYAKYKEQE